ncbi:YraN family protein [Rufibacter psychrotolerans]|uniref:YraN family protein n=1 Tax=Rufibacter psychrotolerans TaxID=2812556 RepID=UPI0019687E65|nr:YraN family protein [Rufibacter sp. SYSU D00308]
MAYNTHLGQLGERAAEAYLTAKGFTVLERNYRHKRAEVDLIVAKEKLLVLVEVKTRSTYAYGFPEEAVSARKEALLQLAADHYVEQHQWRHEVRFDVISILWKNGQPDLVHIEDAFH